MDSWKLQETELPIKEHTWAGSRTPSYMCSLVFMLVPQQLKQELSTSLLCSRASCSPNWDTLSGLSG